MYANAPHGESGRPPLICDNCLMMMDEVRPQASPLCASFDSVDHESFVCELYTSFTSADVRLRLPRNRG